VKTNSDEAAALLLRVYAKNPDHPVQCITRCTANDVPGRENQSVAITRKYDEIAPDNPHALHMPTHIYTRLGEWDASITGDQRAASAALRTRAGDHGQYVWDEFAHAEEYLIYALLQKGDDNRAFEQLERLRQAAPEIEPTFKLAFHVASTQDDSSVALMRQGADIEAATPKHAVTPGPTVPAYEQLGDLLTERKLPVEALAAYKRSLELYPHRFNSLVGAGEPRARPETRRSRARSTPS
jgi:tetratricopeptide (TPR) repeat protein